MARLMKLDSEPAYRAVILKRYPGINTDQPKMYFAEAGVTVDYHESEVYGPYSKKGTATAQMNDKVEHLTQYGEWYKGDRVKPEVEAFVETALPDWTKVQ